MHRCKKKLLRQKREGGRERDYFPRANIIIYKIT